MHFFFTPCLCLSLSLSLSLISEAHLSEAHSFNSGLSSSLYLPPPARLIVNVIGPPAVPSHWSASDPCRRSPQTHFSSVDQTHTDTVLLTEAQLCDWWFFILFVIGAFVWSRLRKKIGDFGCGFFFSFSFLLWTSGGGGGGGCGCGCG